MKGLFLFFFCLVAFAHAADGDSFDLPYAEFVEIDEETAKVFQEASCEKSKASNCSFPGNDVLFGSFTGENHTEAVMLVGLPLDGGSFPPGVLFGLLHGTWQQLGPFDSDYSFSIGNKCRAIPSTRGNELLLCEDTIMAYSYDDFVDYEFPPSYMLWLLDFSKSPVMTTLFSTRNMPGNSLFCRDLHTEEAFKLFDDVQMTFDDLNADTNLDIVMALRETEINASNCAVGGIEDAVMKLDGGLPVRHELHWLFDGETFTPTPETKAFLDNLPNQ